LYLFAPHYTPEKYISKIHFRAGKRRLFSDIAQTHALGIGRKLSSNEVPVDEVIKEILLVRATVVLVVEVVSVLPHIHSQQGNMAFIGQWVLSTDRLGHLKSMKRKSTT
jgi:hypothetical protein